MAIFHLTAKIVSRGRGQSAVAKAAYNSRQNLTNEATGEKHDYTRKGGEVFEGIFAPKNSPEWVHDRERLWSEVERGEKRKDSQLAREVEIALPHELTDDQRRQLVTDYVRENFVRKGMLADVAIHAPCREGDDRNHHAHILLTMREIGPEGFGPKVREWNSPAQLETWRENWARTANRYLERHGHEARIDPRSLETQGIEREPTTHNGPMATKLEREGAESERGNINREIEQRNRERESLKTEKRGIDQELSEHAWDEQTKQKAPEKDVTREFEEAANVIHKTTDVLVKGIDETLDFFFATPQKENTFLADAQKREENWQTEYQRVKAERDALREELGLIREIDRERGRRRDYDGGRERELERE